MKQVLIGIVLGALLVGFVVHVRTERDKRAPAVAASAPAPASRAGDAAASTPDGKKASVAFSQSPIAVVTAPVRIARLSLETEALGTARANESVDVTAKISNIVATVRFAEGQQVRRGQVLVELDGKEARADLAVAEAALSESRSQFNRSRELYATRALSAAQLEQIEATLKANDARVASAALFVISGDVFAFERRNGNDLEIGLRSQIAGPLYGCNPFPAGGVRMIRQQKRWLHDQP